MANNNAESIRAARRKARILNNTEGRINRILGHETNNDKNSENNTDIVKQLSSDNAIRVSNSIDQLIPDPLPINESPVIPLEINSKSLNNQSKSENINSSDKLNETTKSTTILKVENDKHPINYKRFTIILWILFGIAIRFVLETDAKWIFGSSALAPFLIAYVTKCFAEKYQALNCMTGSNNESNLNVVEIALRLCGLSAHNIKILMSIKNTSGTFLKTFSLFTFPFIITHLAINLVQSNNLHEE